MTIGVVVKNNTESTIFTQKSQFYAKIRHSFRVYKIAPQQCVRSPFFPQNKEFFLRDFPELCGKLLRLTIHTNASQEATLFYKVHTQLEELLEQSLFHVSTRHQFHRSHVATPIQNVRLQDDISVAVLYKIVSAP